MRVWIHIVLFDNISWNISLNSIKLNYVEEAIVSSFTYHTSILLGNWRQLWITSCRIIQVLNNVSVRTMIFIIWRNLCSSVHLNQPLIRYLHYERDLNMFGDTIVFFVWCFHYFCDLISLVYIQCLLIFTTYG